MKHIKITQPGWEGYTGMLGLVEFKDAVSVEPVPELHANRISAHIMTETLDENGKSAGQHGVAADLVGGITYSAEPNPELARAKLSDLIAERRKAITDSEKPPAQIYTREQLEEIADDRGINGLRELGHTWGVKDRSIPGLIGAILQAQYDWQKSREDAMNARRAREAESMKKSIELENAKNEEIRSKSRNLEDEGRYEKDREAAEADNEEFDRKRAAKEDADEAGFVEEDEEDKED